jgi:hypothetical protein
VAGRGRLNGDQAVGRRMADPEGVEGAVGMLRPSPLDGGQLVGVELVLPGFDIQHEKFAAVARREQALNFAFV